MNQPALGKKISELRKAKGLTQEELVDLCNISVRTIQRIETGEVTPRSYTIKTILTALGSDIDELQIDQSYSEVAVKWLNVAWMAGIAYFVLGFFEGPMDMVRFSEEVVPPEAMSGNSLFPELGYNQGIYLIVKVLVALTYIFFFRGFVLVGETTQNSLLRISAIILICFMVLVLGYDVVSLFYPSLSHIIIISGISVALGMLSIVFGLALIQLRSSLGVACLVAGGLEILAGCLFLFINPFGLILQMPAEIVEVIILYKSVQMLKVKTSKPAV